MGYKKTGWRPQDHAFKALRNEGKRVAAGKAVLNRKGGANLALGHMIQEERKPMPHGLKRDHKEERKERKARMRGWRRRQERAAQEAGS